MSKADGKLDFWASAIAGSTKCLYSSGVHFSGTLKVSSPPLAGIVAEAIESALTIQPTYNRKILSVPAKTLTEYYESTWTVHEVSGRPTHYVRDCYLFGIFLLTFSILHVLSHVFLHPW